MIKDQRVEELEAFYTKSIEKYGEAVQVRNEALQALKTIYELNAKKVEATFKEAYDNHKGCLSTYYENRPLLLDKIRREGAKAKRLEKKLRLRGEGHE